MEELDHIRINEFSRTGKCGFQALPLCADQWAFTIPTCLCRLTTKPGIPDGCPLLSMPGRD